MNFSLRSYCYFADDTDKSQFYDKAHDAQYKEMSETETSHEDNTSDKQLKQENTHEVSDTSFSSDDSDSINEAKINNKGCFGAAEKGLLEVSRSLSKTLTGSHGAGPVVKDHPHVVKLCSPLQILSAMFSAFAHGGNDVR